jgi:DNA-binding YbaB/EbfC family protein
MGMDMFKMIKEAASLQKNVKKIQSGLARKTVECSSGGDAVTVVAAGDGTVRSIRINPEVVSADRTAKLESLVLAAMSGALKKARDLGAEEVSKVAAGLGLPGM